MKRTPIFFEFSMCFLGFLEHVFWRVFPTHTISWMLWFSDWWSKSTCSKTNQQRLERAGRHSGRGRWTWQSGNWGSNHLYPDRRSQASHARGRRVSGIRGSWNSSKCTFYLPLYNTCVCSELFYCNDISIATTCYRRSWSRPQLRQLRFIASYSAFLYSTIVLTLSAAWLAD